MLPIGKILVIRLSSIGDILLTTPVLRALRTKFPATELDMLVKAEYSSLVRYNPHCSSILEFGTGHEADLNAISKQIRDEHYDLIVDLHNSLRSRYLRFFADAREVRVVNKRVVERFVLVQTKQNLYRAQTSVPDRYFETVREFGVTDDGGSLEIYFPAGLGDAVRTKLVTAGVEPGSTVIAIAPMARHNTKMWLPDRFAQYGREMADRAGATILILGDSAARDYCGNITTAINHIGAAAKAVNCAGMFSLLETAALFDLCSLVVVNDSGLMHLAAARQRPVIAIFGPTVEQFGFFPYRTPSVVVQEAGLNCRPCSHIGSDRCPQGHFGCMGNITVDRLMQATEKLLQLRVSS